MLKPLSVPLGHVIDNLGLKRTAYGNCPCCGYKDALAITQTEGQKLYHCHAGCSQDSLWRVLKGYEPPTYQPVLKTHQRFSNESAKTFALSLWQQSYPAEGTPVETYLVSRGISASIPASLRYLPNQLHKPSATQWPVMLACVTDATGQFQAVHRTYLAHNGKSKASVEPGKMTLGAVSGFACHLGHAGEELAISEGIETGLSVQLATGIASWAALSAGGIRNLILPLLPQAQLVTIAADADPVGMKSAQIASQRWKAEGRQVRIVTPPETGTDFNDVLRLGRA